MALGFVFAMRSARYTRAQSRACVSLTRIDGQLRFAFRILLSLETRSRPGENGNVPWLTVSYYRLIFPRLIFVSVSRRDGRLLSKQIHRAICSYEAVIEIRRARVTSYCFVAIFADANCFFNEESLDSIVLLFQSYNSSTILSHHAFWILRKRNFR